MLECLNPKNSRTAHFRTAVFLQINFQITVMETFQLGLEINEDFSPPQKLNGGSDPARQHPSSQLCPWQQHFACVCVQGEQEGTVCTAGTQTGRRCLLSHLSCRKPRHPKGNEVSTGNKATNPKAEFITLHPVEFIFLFPTPGRKEVHEMQLASAF